MYSNIKIIVSAKTDKEAIVLVDEFIENNKSDNTFDCGEIDYEHGIKNLTKEIADEIEKEKKKDEEQYLQDVNNYISEYKNLNSKQCYHLYWLCNKVYDINHSISCLTVYYNIDNYRARMPKEKEIQDYYVVDVDFHF